VLQLLLGGREPTRAGSGRDGERTGRGADPAPGPGGGRDASRGARERPPRRREGGDLMAAGPATGKGAAHAAWVMNLLTDLSFNLLIFFVVCASSAQEQKGKPQQVPSTQSENKPSENKPQNVEVA